MFVIPMAGLSARFFSAGFSEPKYKLKANGKTLFALSVESFRAYFKSDHFVFIVRADYDTPAFVKREVESLGIRSYDIIVIEIETKGQAETVALGLTQLKNFQDHPIYIFNIDTFRPGYEKPKFPLTVDGYLETFIGNGPNWSNIEPVRADSDQVKRTSEKQEISKYCCTGLYYWSSGTLYLNTYQKYSAIENKHLQGGEYYVAPMYNLAISSGADIRYTIIPVNEVIFCGTPGEYQDYLSK